MVVCVKEDENGGAEVDPLGSGGTWTKIVGGPN